MSRAKFILIVSAGSFICILGILGFVVFRYKTMPLLPTVDQSGVNSSLLGAIKREDLGDEAIYIVSGRIKDIKNSQITLATFEFEENLLLKNKEFIITFGSDSGVWVMNNPFFNISKINDQVKVVVDNFPDGREGSQKMGLDELAIGDSILALSLSDIRGKDSFTAKEIYKYSK